MPNAEIGQQGDDSDATESKDAWVADMYNRIMTDYPGIRAVAWFNTNKELSWALNQTAHSGLPNTGLSSYNQLIVAVRTKQAQSSWLNPSKHQQRQKHVPMIQLPLA